MQAGIIFTINGWREFHHFKKILKHATIIVEKVNENISWWFLIKIWNTVWNFLNALETGNFMSNVLHEWAFYNILVLLKISTKQIYNFINW